jgi:hypothetical protein
LELSLVDRLALQPETKKTFTARSMCKRAWRRKPLTPMIAMSLSATPVTDARALMANAGTASRFHDI